MPSPASPRRAPPRRRPRRSRRRRASPRGRGRGAAGVAARPGAVTGIHVAVPGSRDADEPREQQELLPGLVRARVAADPQGRGARPSRWPASTRSRGCWSTCRWPTSTAPSTTPCPPSMADDAQPGVRVKVRFAGRDVDGFVRRAGRRPPTTTGSLTPLRRVVSPEPVLSPAGGRAGRGARRALRRHPLRRAAAGRPGPARGHREEGLRARRCRRRRTTPPRPRPPGPPTRRRRRSSRHLADGGSPRAVWSAAPGTDWPTLVAHAVAATRRRRPRRAGRRARRQGRRPVDAALTAVLGADQHVVLTADAGPAKRYRDFLAVVARSPPGRGRHPRRGVRAGRRTSAWW